MDRIFQIKHMRFIAVLMAAAVFTGSIDTGMLRVHAYESGMQSDDTSMLSGSGEPTDGVGYADDSTDSEEEKEKSSGAVSDNDIEDADGTEADDPSDERDTVVIQAEDEPAEIDEEGKTQVTISGVKIFSTPYDGKAITYNKDGVKIEKTPTEQEDGDVTDDLKSLLTYQFSGTLADGTQYPSGGGATEAAPINAGKYKLIVAVPENNGQYEGSKEYDFVIEQRQLTIRPDDVEWTVGDVIPEEYEYTYTVTGDGFVDEEDFITEPTVTCGIESTVMEGEYPIIASGADAGNNYNITYEEGTLTVSPPEPEKAKFLRVIQPAAVRDVPFGTLIANIPLPETVQIVVTVPEAQEGQLQEAKKDAKVNWSRSPIDGTTYNPNLSVEQIFKLGGTVVLPDDVELPEDTEEDTEENTGEEAEESTAGDAKENPLYVKIEVHVREKLESNMAVATPTASIDSGSTVAKGTRVELFCETEGAVIYYTLDGTEPTRQSNRYSTSIEINAYTSIKAFAVRVGYPDSAVTKFSYFVSTVSDSGKGDDEPEVPAEDIPSSGVIPPGLWTPEVKNDLVYTGKAIKPEIRVYDYKTLLTENKDYTVSYKNNVNAADANAAKAPTITITGKGNYEGKLTKTFTIKPKSISDTDVSVDDITVAYNKKAQKPSPTVMWGSKKLANKKEYTVQDVSYTDVGSRAVTVTGCGNYTGTRNFVFTITDGVPVSKLTVSKIPDQTYNWGEKIEPELTVKYKGQLLKLNEHYKVTYQNNVEVGTATAVIEGIGNIESAADSYVGTRKVTFKIKEVASLSKANIDVQFNSTPVYTGQKIQADSVNVTINLKDENGQTVPTTLIENKDYTVTYQKNDKVGTATIVFTGMRAYGGTAKKTFKIVAYDMQGGNVIISGLNSPCPYAKGGAKLEPTVKFGGTVLKPGTDYTLSYKQNNAVGNTATVTVKGKGNFKGSRTGTFTITQQDIGKVTVNAADKVYQNKKNIYKTTVRLTDVNGKALSAGTDYNKDIEYTYAEKVTVKNAADEDVSREKGEIVTADDIIPAGTVINVKISTEGAKGNNYTGAVSGTYRIVEANISGAKVTIPTQTYTGKAIEPDSEIQVVFKGQTLIKDTDYEIVGYSNNINKGTAKVTIQGLGDYGGTKTATFKIKGKGLFG